MTEPLATYRLQLTPSFTFADAAAAVPYIAGLGVSHLYLSPIAEAAEGSEHGYDVTDPGVVRAALGGEDGLRALADVAHAHGLGIIVDIVPNHVAADPANPWWWDVLTHGPEAGHARHFDIDWAPADGRFSGRIVLGVLDDHYGRVLARGDLRLDVVDDVPVVRWPGGILPLTPATISRIAAEPDAFEEAVAAINADRHALHEVLEAQHHILMRWQRSADELDYRRFFDQSHLVGVRVEDPAVFDDVHRTALRLHHDGVIDGFRVDHVDGLVDPAGYLHRLREAAPDAWIVVEKILLGEEALPPWPIDGTTGYDALVRVNGLGIDPEGLDALTAAWPGSGDPDEERRACRALVVDTTLHAELARCTQLFVLVCDGSLAHRDFTRRELAAALRAAALATPAYRTYVVPGTPSASTDAELVDRCLADAAVVDPTVDADLWAFLRGILLDPAPGPAAELVQRFQQLTGPVAAKGDEDTFAYRWTALASAAEVGGEPDRPCTTPEDLHRWAARAWPRALVSMTTHDTKRSEDVRSRLAVLSQDPVRFLDAFAAISASVGDDLLDGPLQWLLAQVAFAARPITGDRLVAYAIKAAREAKVVTSWTAPDQKVEEAIERYAAALVEERACIAALDALHEAWGPALLDQSLVQKAIALTLPGVPDVYQGAERLDLRLVDPDNRTPVRLEDDGPHPKRDLVRSVLALRRRHPFRSYEPIGAPPDVVAYRRDDTVAVVAARFALHRRTRDFDGARAIELPEGTWRDVLSGRTVEVATLDAVLGDACVAVLERA